MNRYPLWKYLIIAFVVLIATLFTLPNFFGEAPAVQVSSGKATVKVDAVTRTRVEDALAAAKVAVDGKIELDGNSVRARFSNTEVQKLGQSAITSALNPDKNDPAYVVALNLVPQTPQWLRSLHANPMYRIRRWTDQGWRALASALRERGLSVVVTGGPDPAERQYLDSLWDPVTPPVERMDLPRGLLDARHASLLSTSQ